LKKLLLILLIVVISLTFIICFGSNGCAKAVTLTEISKTDTTKSNVTSNTTTLTEVTSETSRETTAAVTNVIVFSSLIDNQGIIYICNPDGSNLQKFIEDGINTSPSWNKQHSKIVFTSIDPASGVGGLYVYDMESKSKTLLLKRFSPRDPGFSPDGNTIVFADFIEDGSENAEIYTMGIDGSNLTKLTNNPARDYFPKYSPDGKTIVFSSERDGNIQLYTMNSNGENVKRLMENGFTDNCGSFSTDSRNIIFNSNRGGNSDIYTISSDGTGEAKNITNNSAGNYEACYAPDGSMIAYRSNKGLSDNMSYDIFVMSADGRNQTDITSGLKNTNEFNPSW
jgi:Tol biopolymer transport system component